MTHNEKIKVGLCDDEEYVCSLIEKELEIYKQNKESDFSLIYYKSAKELLEKKDKLDFLLLDIDMPEMDGIEAGLELQKRNINYRIIMLTARDDRFREAFKIGAFRFVSKPIEEEELFQAFDDLIDSLQIEENVKVYKNNIGLMIPQKEIMYIEANHSSSLIYASGDVYRSENSLKEWMEVLSEKFFIQSHKSYIVNMNKIDRIEDSKIILVSGEQILVSRRLKAEVLKAYMLYDTRRR